MVTVRRRATHASKKRRKEDRSLVFRSSKFHPFRSKFSPKRGADLRPRRGANSSVKSFVQEEEGGGARNARKLNSWRKYRWNEPTNNPRSLPFLLSKSCIQLGLSLIYQGHHRQRKRATFAPSSTSLLLSALRVSSCSYRADSAGKMWNFQQSFRSQRHWIKRVRISADSVKNRFASLINRNNRRIGRVQWSILRREIVPCSFRIYFLLVWKGRKSDWGEICVDARSSVVFCVVSSPPRSRIVPRYGKPNRVCEFNRQFIYLLLFFFSSENLRRRVLQESKKICGVHQIELLYFLRLCLFEDVFVVTFLLYSLPARFLRHLVRRVSIDAFATRIEQPSPGRYLMKRQSHLRIAISNSARQRRTRGRVGGRRQRSRSAVTR